MNVAHLNEGDFKQGVQWGRVVLFLFYSVHSQPCNDQPSLFSLLSPHATLPQHFRLHDGKSGTILPSIGMTVSLSPPTDKASWQKMWRLLEQNHTRDWIGFGMKERQTWKQSWSWPLISSLSCWMMVVELFLRTSFCWLEDNKGLSLVLSYD